MMRLIAVYFGLLSFVLMVNAGVAAERKASDVDYQALTILTRNCASCHNQADHPGALFLSQARLSEPATIKLITSLIESSTMPLVHANFKNTADGKTLLKWLKSKNKAEKP